MSLVAEIIAKHLGEKEKLDWRRIVQLLASYGGSTSDVRRDLSGLKEWEGKILREYVSCLEKLESGYGKKLDIFDLIGNEKEVAERTKIEIERKRKILPFLVKNAGEFANRIGKNLYILTPMIFLRGSASPRSPKLFIYYEGGSGEKIFVSDVDLNVLLPCYPDREIKEYVKKEACKFSLEREIPIDVFIAPISSVDEGLFKYGYPLFIPYEIEERFIIKKNL
jgi:hypothetical protein